VWEHADLDEVRREWRAQIERAVLWGFHITHLDTHLAGVELKPEFFDVYLELAEEFRLPVRLPGADEERRIGFPFRAEAEERGIVAPDRVIALRDLGTDPDAIIAGLGALPHGVTEVHAHPAVDSSELRSATPDWAERVHEYAILQQLESIISGAEALGVVFIAYRELTALARGESYRPH
jgi:predicted glycoside hydrolase/deacetylase ChbG (UPF0249 family)